MADNKTFQSGTVATLPAGTIPATKEVSFSGDTADVQLIEIVSVTGSEGSRTLNEISDANGLTVNLGTNNDVTLATLPDTSAGDLAAINAALGGALTVGSHAVTNAGTFAVQEDGAALTALQLIDDIVATLGTATYSEATTKGAVIGAVRNDTLAALANTDNEIAPLQVNASGALYIQEGTALDVSAATVTVDLGANNDVTLATLPDTAAGDLAAINTAVSGTLTVGSHAVTNAGTFAVQVDGDALTALQLIDNIVQVEDAVHGDGDSGVMALAVRNDTLAALAGTDGDYAPLQVNASGALFIQEGSALDVSGATVTVDGSGVTQPISHAALTELAAAINANEIDINIASDSVGIGGGTQYTEDAAAAANPVGNAVILIRDDSPGTLTSDDGDNVAQRGTDYGAAFVQVVDSSGNFIDSFGGSGGTAAADDADFVAGTTQGTLVQGVYESSPSSVTDGDMGAVGITETRSMKVQETNSTAILADTANMDTNLGTLAGAVSGSEVQVDIVSGNVTNAGTFAVQVDGDALTALQLIDDIIYADDADWSDGSSKHALVGGLYQTTPQTVTDGDVAPFQIDSNGNFIESNSAAILADTANMDTNLGTLAGAVSGSEIQVDIVADGAGLLTTTAHDAAFGTAGSADAQVRSVQGVASMTPLLVDATGQGDIPITLDSEEVTVNLGTVDNAVLDNIDTQTAGAETALELIDGAIIGPGEPSVDSYTQASFNLTAAADQVLVSSAANKQIWVYGIGFVLSAAGTVSFQDEDDTAVTGIMPFAANSGMAFNPSGNFSMPMWKLGTDKDLEVDLVTAEMDGWISYAIVDVS